MTQEDRTRLRDRWEVFLPFGALAGAGLFIAGKALYQRWSDQNTYDGERIPAEGMLLNPAGENPGDPENARKDLRRIHSALVAFRAAHGRMPKSPFELLDAGKRGEIDLKDEDYINPDAAFGDDDTLQRDLKAGKPIPTNVSYGFEWCGPDAAGRPRPEPTADKPVKWVSTMSYTRDHARVLPGREYRYRPGGYMLYLWSDGRITKEERGAKKMVREADDSWRPLAEGEAPGGREVVDEAELYRRLERGSLFSK